jgi:hypothetical protein
VPRPKALVHRIWIERGILAEALIEAGERVEAQERLILRQHVPLLGKEQEHEPQDDSEQGSVDFVGMLCEWLAQEFAL